MLLFLAGFTAFHIPIIVAAEEEEEVIDIDALLAESEKETEEEIKARKKKEKEENDDTRALLARLDEEAKKKNEAFSATPSIKEKKKEKISQDYGSWRFIEKVEKASAQAMAPVAVKQSNIEVARPVEVQKRASAQASAQEAAEQEIPKQPIPETTKKAEAQAIPELTKNQTKSVFSKSKQSSSKKAINIKPAETLKKTSLSDKWKNLDIFNRKTIVPAVNKAIATLEKQLVAALQKFNKFLGESQENMQNDQYELQRHIELLIGGFSKIVGTMQEKASNTTRILKAAEKEYGGTMYGPISTSLTN